MLKVFFICSLLCSTALSAAPAGFAGIDISRRCGDGRVALNNAKSVCPASLGPAQLERIRRIAEAAELEFFNPAIAGAASRAIRDVIQCQKDRNKVLKNQCQLQRALIVSDQFQIDQNNMQLRKNTADVTSRCRNVNTALFIRP